MVAATKAVAVEVTMSVNLPELVGDLIMVGEMMMEVDPWITPLVGFGLVHGELFPGSREAYEKIINASLSNCG